MKRFMQRQSSMEGTSRKGEQGYLIVVAVVIATTLIGLSTALISIVASKYAKTAENNAVVNTVYAAEAGISDTIARMNTEFNFPGYPENARKVLYSSTERGRAEYATTVTNNGNNIFTITSNGYYYQTSTTPSSSSPTQKRTVRVVAQRSERPIKENIVAGSGGLAIQGWSTNPASWWGGGDHPGITGSVYSRGKISVKTGSALSKATIGNPTTSVNVVAGNVGCGTAADWPRPCGPSSPPLAVSGGTIYGTVCATDQVSSTGILNGPTGAGLVAGCEAPTYKKPRFDKASHAAAMSTTITGSAASCSNGSRTYANNTQINGNVTISGFGFFGCTVYIQGDVYIKGSLTISGSGKVVVSDSAGTRKPRVVVNGKTVVGFMSNGGGVFANSQGTPLALLGFWSTDSACSNSDSCTEISRAHAFNSSYRNDSNLDQMWANVLVDPNLALIIVGDTNAQLGGLMAYSYFGIAVYGKSGVTDMYGLGGEAVYINDCAYLTAGSCSFASSGMNVKGIAPYEGILHYDQYSILDYQQVF